MLLIKLSIVLAFAFGICYANFVSKHLEEIGSPSSLISRVKEFLNAKSSDGISLKCKAHLGGLVKGWTSGKLWAMRMLDAGSKIPSGVLEGNFVYLGSFDECLKVEKSLSKKEKIFGKYCLGTIPFDAAENYIPKPQEYTNFLQLINPETRSLPNNPEEAGFYFATCFPEACMASDLEQLYRTVFKLGVVTFKEDKCQSRASAPELSGGAIATLSFLGVVLVIMVLSTAYDVALFYLNNKPAHSLLIAFSAFTNGRKLMSTSFASNQISCLHGIRVISTMWVILGHRFSIQSGFPMRNTIFILDFVRNKANMLVLGATVSVDTFFLISGVVVVYVYLCAMQKGMKFNVILYYFHRYLRLTPVLAVIMVIHITLLRHLGSGPLWSSGTSTLITGCEINWWKSLLYIQNYRDTVLCVPQTWYLSVDTQLFLLSPILLIPLKYWPKFTLIATGFLAFCSVLAGFLICWFLELSFSVKVSMVDEKASEEYMIKYYIATWTRAAPWLIGFVLGYYIFKAKQSQTRLVMNKVVLMASWAVALAILCTCVFAGNKMFIGDYNRLETSLYLSLVRPAWSIALAWIIFACVTGNGGPVNWFLSLPIFQVVSKLTFTLYLVHYTIITMVTAQMRTTPVLSSSYGMYVFWGDFVYTAAVALVFTLAFESPLITIEKFLLGGGSKKTAEQPQVVQQPIKSADIA